MPHPFIIIGAHRSGTTLLAGILEQLGIFMGRRKDENNEALFFRRLNHWMLNSVSADWDYPGPFLALAADESLCKTYVDYLKIMMRSPRVISYMGLSAWLRERRPAGLNIPWGWKDPRNTFTLPLWLEVFGGARVIHVRRHGLDVARSLTTRNDLGRRQGLGRFEKLRRFPLIYRLRPKRGGFTYSLRCRNLGGAFEIWAEYMRRAEQVTRETGVPCLELQYEALLREPVRELERIVRFCGREDRSDEIPRIVNALDAARAFAWQRDPACRQFAVDHAGELSQFGYPLSRDDFPRP